MNQNFLKYLALGTPLLLAACSEETVINNEPGEMLPIKVQVSVPELTTRTQLTENAGNLAWQWTDNDQLAVTDANGVNKGSLKLISFDNQQHTVATFEGTISSTLPNGDNQLNIIYTSQDPAAVSGTHDCDYSQQDGQFASLKNRDVLVTTVTAKKTDAYVLIPSFSMSHCFSAGHFSLSFAGETPEITKVEVTGANVRNKAVVDLKNMTWTGTEGTVTINTTSADFYMTLIPADNVDMQFKAYASDGKEYEGSLGVTFNLANATYLRKDLGNGSYAGIPVEMTSTQPEEPKEDDTVGPVFTINGKKFKFTRGNLAYNRVSDTWEILEKQTYYIGEGGVATNSSVGTTKETIDLFSWGANGLEDAQSPILMRAQGWESSYNGSYFPTTVSSSNRSITNLWDNEFVYDWGRAYMEKGRSSKDKRQYITPSMEVMKSVISSTFANGCTVKGAGMNGEDVTGLIIIPEITSLDDAKDLINNTDGAVYKSTMKKLTENSTQTSFTYGNITLDNYNILKELNNALFLPAAGKQNLNSGNVYKSSGYGYYWYATSMTSGTNANNLYFYGNTKSTSNNGFFHYSWVSGGAENSNNAWSGRDQKMAVRLLVEVTE